MNIGWEDHYKTLQVHHTADPDTIAGVYRILSKKYHPDVNRSGLAEEQMKKLNAAYSVIGDAEKRAAYDAEWLQRNGAARVISKKDGAGAQASGAQLDARAAQIMINKYYGDIAAGRFDGAYECVSRQDRRRISKADFIKWQKAVAKRFKIRSFSVVLYKAGRNKFAGNKLFDETYEFTVDICERDVERNSISDYKASKTVVNEGGDLGVYLGYKDVKAFIAALGRMQAGKSGAGADDEADNFEAGSSDEADSGDEAESKTKKYAVNLSLAKKGGRNAVAGLYAGARKFGPTSRIMREKPGVSLFGFTYRAINDIVSRNRK